MNVKYMKRILILITIFLFSLSFIPAQALLISPFLNLTITKTTIGGDGSFNFHVDAYQNNSLYFSEDPTIITQNGQGNTYVGTTSGWGDTYYLTEDLPNGWVFIGANCTSNNPNITFEPIDSGVRIITQPYSSVSCNFTNI